LGSSSNDIEDISAMRFIARIFDGLNENAQTVY
jgi:hypothetical protein